MRHLSNISPVLHAPLRQAFASAGAWRLFISISFLLTGAVASASNCFDRHLVDAITQNSQRATLYSRLSNGKTNDISRRLIFGEKISRALSRFYDHFDQRAKPYQARGMTLMCEEFVDMKTAPAYDSLRNGSAPLLSEYKTPDAKRLKKEFHQALSDEGFLGVMRVARRALAEINTEPRFNCMTRHMLESVIHIADLAPRHIQRANELGLPSPEAISRDLLESHWRSFPLITDLDVRAAPLQSEGIPILCQDVPPIPLPNLESDQTR